MEKDEFVRMMTTDLPEAPAYFGRDVEANRGGAEALGKLPKPVPLSPAEVEARRRAGAVVLDTRPASEFAAGHVPGAMHMGLSGQFASWGGTLLPAGAPIVLVTEDEERVAESQTRLARVGIETIVGFLGGGIAAWDAAGLPLAKTEQVGVDELAARIAEGGAGQVLDVRRPGEWKAGHIASALHIPLNELSARAAELDPSRPTHIICASGYRSSIATSLLEQKGFTHTVNVVGGMTAWTAARFETAA